MGFGRGAPRKDGGFRVNEDIRISQIRLVDQDGEMVGVVPKEEGLALAREHNLDLVEVSPNADPPVCKVLDYGKFKYEQKKREHEAKKKHRRGDFKEVRFRPKTDTHDRDIKLHRAKSFLAEGDRVQITLMFRGREMQHASALSREILSKIAKELDAYAKIERHISREGRRASMSLIAKPGAEKLFAEEEKERLEREKQAKEKVEQRKKKISDARRARRKKKQPSPEAEKTEGEAPVADATAEGQAPS